MGVEYWKVDWLHDFESEAIRFFCEIGEDGYEVRKVQEYRDGRKLRADELHESGEIALGEVAVGSLDEVNSEPEFLGVLIEPAEFEKQWQTAPWPT